MTALCSLTAHFRFFMLRCCFFSYINFTIRVHFCCRLRSGDAQAFFLIGMCWKIEESHIELKEIDFWSNTDSKFSANLLESAIKSRALIRANEKKNSDQNERLNWNILFHFIIHFFLFSSICWSHSVTIYSLLSFFFSLLKWTLLWLCDRVYKRALVHSSCDSFNFVSLYRNHFQTEKTKQKSNR